MFIKYILVCFLIFLNNVFIKVGDVWLDGILVVMLIVFIGLYKLFGKFYVIEDWNGFLVVWEWRLFVDVLGWYYLLI